MYRLLVTDIDGTLLCNDHKISSKNKKAIRQAIDKGVHVALCSGRSRMSTLKFEEELNLRQIGNYGIGSNGGCVYETDTRHVLREVRLEHNIGLKILNQLERFKVPTIVFGSDTEYIDKRFVTSLLLDKYLKVTATKHIWVDDCRNAPEDFIKILIVGSNERLREIQAELMPILGNECNIFFSAGILLEFTDPQVSKGSGVEYLAGLLDIPRAEVLAVGDNHNDIPMIKWAGMGVAVNNAVDDAKLAAKYITKSNNNNNAIDEVVREFITG